LSAAQFFLSRLLSQHQLILSIAAGILRTPKFSAKCLRFRLPCFSANNTRITWSLQSRPIILRLPDTTGAEGAFAPKADHIPIQEFRGCIPAEKPSILASQLSRHSHTQQNAALSIGYSRPTANAERAARNNNLSCEGRDLKKQNWKPTWQSIVKLIRHLRNKVSNTSVSTYMKLQYSCYKSKSASHCSTPSIQFHQSNTTSACS